ncbi:MAG: hypothetical protein ACSLFH_07725 [Desulfuromonadales bacterium]
MRPKKPDSPPQSELFNVRLELICDPVDPLVKLADRMRKLPCQVARKLYF